MSLQVWLPLNGDLHNQGLNGLIATNNGATINNNGKIGKCYSFNGSSNYLELDPIFSNGNQILSFSCWMKVSALPSSYYCLLSSRTSTNNTGINIYLKSDKTFYVDIGSRWITQVQDIEANKWYHIAVVSSNEGRILYINGIQKDISTTIHTAPTTANTNSVLIGAQQSSTAGTADGTYFKGYMNDIRIYDHAISAAEVAEIAKGLVLHYKLNEPNSNLLTDLNDGWVIESGVTLSWDSTVNMYKISTNRTTSTSRWGIYKNITLQANTTYTFSIDGMKGVNNGTGAAFAEGATTSWPSYFASFTTTRERKSKTITIGDTDANCKIYLALTPSGEETTKYTYFALPKLEKSNFMTSWISNTTNTNIIYDCSGYQNDGTIVSELSAAADTPRYETSTQFSGTNYFKTISPSIEIKTISLWAKWNSIPSGQSVIYVDYKSKTGFGLMSTGILCSSCGLSSYTFDKTNIVANTWYHFVIVSPNGASNTTRKLYINGREQTPKTTTSNWAYSIDELQIGKRSTTSDGFNGKISDFRMYSTVLSDQQIKELYNTSATIDASGNTYARELKEV